MPERRNALPALPSGESTTSLCEVGEGEAAGKRRV